MSKTQDTKSYAALVRQILQESPEPLTAAEILRRVSRVRPVETRSPEATIRSALASCRLIANDGEGRFGWFPPMLKGSIVRVTLFASDLVRERVYFDHEVRDLLWPSFFTGPGDLLDRNPVTIEMPDGSHTFLSLDHFGQRNWGTLGTPDFWEWLQDCRATTGDALIIEAVDAEARRYRASFDARASRDIAALRKRTEEVEQAAEDYLWRRRAYGVAEWTIARYLLAAGYYRNPVPPEPISAIWNRVVPVQMIGERMIGRRRVASRKARKIYQLMIVLSESEPPVWRRMLVPSGATLYDLHWIIQLGMGWTNSHLHQFIIDEQYYSDPEFELGEDLEPVHDENRTTLDKIFSREGSRFIYEYDFGDCWNHEVTVEKILRPVEGETYPRLIGGERACPPEDCGSVSGYAHFLEAIGDPTHEEHDQLLEWAGGEFDPERFDIERINRQFKRWASLSA